MHLWDEGLDPEELMILNDSVWIVASTFPTFLDRLAALDADVTGAVERSKNGKRWLESYFFRFDKTALNHHAFRAFWQEYRLVDSKFGVIRHGERDFGVALASGGLRVAGLGDNQAFLHRMAQGSDDELRLALAYGSLATAGPADDRSHLLEASSDPHWRKLALEHLGVSLRGGRVWNSQFPIAAMRVMGYPFIKKSREPVNVAWREMLLRGTAAGIVPGASPAVLAELKDRQRQGGLSQPHWMPPV